jgi:hypothetical protein
MPRSRALGFTLEPAEPPSLETWPASPLGGNTAMSTGRRKEIAWGRLIDIITRLLPVSEHYPMNITVSYLVKAARVSLHSSQ